MENSADKHEQRRKSDVPTETPDVPTGIGNVAPSYWRVMFEELQDAVVFLDAEDRILLWSPGAERLTGLAAQAASGELFSKRIGPLLAEEDRLRLERALRERDAETLRFTFSPDGAASLPVACRIAPLGKKDAGCDRAGTVLIMRDASSHVDWERERLALREKTRRDPLTGVANRTEFERVHSQFLESHRRRGTTYSLIIGDIDRFKRINDQRGHPAGDDVILALVDVLQKERRESDLVGRYGGEEFVVLCADCGLSEAAARAEAMREAFALVGRSRREGAPTTVSFGVAELRSDDTVETIFARADQRLLRAKQEGRNRVVATWNQS